MTFEKYLRKQFEILKFKLKKLFWFVVAVFFLVLAVFSFLNDLIYIGFFCASASIIISLYIKYKFPSIYKHSHHKQHYEQHDEQQIVHIVTDEDIRRRQQKEYENHFGQSQLIKSFKQNDIRFKQPRRENFFNTGGGIFSQGTIFKKRKR